MPDQVKAWIIVGAQLSIKVDAPCEIRLSDGTRVRATAHVKQFGAENGMIVDPDWSVLEPYAKALDAHGYGFSALSIGSDPEALIVMFMDWGWSSSERAPAWLSE